MILFRFICNLRLTLLDGICETSGGATYTTFFTTSLPCAVPTAACFIDGTRRTITDVFFHTNALSSSYSLPSCAFVSTSSHAWSLPNPFFSLINRFSSPTAMNEPSKASVSKAFADLNL